MFFTFNKSIKRIALCLIFLLSTAFFCPASLYAEEANTIEDLEKEQVQPQTMPSHMALLLPLTGALAGPGNAIKDGFMSLYNARSVNTAITVRLYDTAKESAATLYQQAIADGADYVIGPLTKAEVAAVAALEHPVPTLVLNDISLDNTHNLFRFGLSPQHEAEQVAKKAFEDGFNRALIIAPKNAWGDDIVHAFAIALQNAGGEVVDSLSYDNGQDLNPLIHDFLQVVEHKVSAKVTPSRTARQHVIEATRRGDFDMIFVLAYPSKARQIIPLLKYYYASDIPVYATSAVYSGSPNKIQDKDLDGMIFCDIPWVLEHPIAPKNWPETLNSYSRLYALGMDSFSLSSHLQELVTIPATGITDESGVFYATAEKKLSRELVFRQFSQGIAGKICRNKLV